MKTRLRIGRSSIAGNRGGGNFHNFFLLGFFVFLVVTTRIGLCVSVRHDLDGIHSDHVETASAFCLIVKDDNDILSEWVAYHYHVFNMRRLIVAVDPASKTSPLDVLEAWESSKGNFDLDLTIWNDEDYAPDFFPKNYSAYPNALWNAVTFENHEKLTKNQIRHADALFRPIVKTEWHTNETYVREHQEEVRQQMLQINSHRYRQRNFLTECYKQLMKEQPPSGASVSKNGKKNSVSWAVHIDTDEFLVPNPWISEYIHRSNNQITNTLQSLIPEKPSSGSLWSLFRAFLGDNTENRVCVNAPRILFGSREDKGSPPGQTVAKDSPGKTIYWNHSKFESLRWKYHVDFMTDSRPKAIVNVAGLDLSIKIFKDKKVYSIHRPLISKPGCRLQPLRIYNEYQYREPLAVYHYLGSLEKYLSRKDDRRDVAVYNHKNELANYAKGDENKHSNNEDARWWIGGWLDDFVETHGGEKAYLVLGERYARKDSSRRS